MTRAVGASLLGFTRALSIANSSTAFPHFLPLNFPNSPNFSLQISLKDQTK